MKLIAQTTTILFFIFISFYTALLFTPLLEQTTTNPYQIVGPTTNQNYNPQNNTIRYLFLTLGTIAIFFLLKYLNDFKFKKAINIFIILIISTSFILSQVTIFNNKLGNIDMFHDGEQLGVGSAIHFFNKSPFNEIIFLHGFFADPGIALLSFNLLGASIGSFYFINSLLTIISFIVLLLILSLIIKDKFLYIMLSFYLVAGASNFSFSRDLLSFIFILLTFLMCTKRISIFKGIFLTTLITSLNFIYSLDRAYYAAAANVFFISLTTGLYIFKVNTQKKLYLFKTFITVILALACTIIILISLFGLESFKEFLIISFIKIPQIKPFLDEYQFPQLSLRTLFPYWIPIFIIIGSNILAIHYTIKTKSNLLSPFIVTVNVMSLLYYRSAIGRSDTPHIIYVFPMVVIAFIITGSAISNFQKSLVTKYLVYILAICIFLLPYINYQKLFLPPVYKTDDVIQFITLFTTKDERWITAEQQTVTSFITSNSTINDYVFVYTNESAYYYLFNRKNPTRFYTIWFASPNYYQQEVIKDLQKNKPKYIIYKNSYWSNNIDGIPNTKRFPIIEKWLSENYRFDQKVMSTEILKPK